MLGRVDIWCNSLVVVKNCWHIQAKKGNRIPINRNKYFIQRFSFIKLNGKSEQKKKQILL